MEFITNLIVFNLFINIVFFNSKIVIEYYYSNLLKYFIK